MFTRSKANPIRYSVPMMLLLTICLLFAEHQSAQQMHGNIDLDYVISKQSGRPTREVAYLVVGLIGIIGIVHKLGDRRSRIFWNPRIAVTLCLLLGWSALSLIWTDTPMITAKRLFVIGLTFMGALGLAMSWTQTQILKFMALSAALQVAVGLGAEILYGFFTPFDSDYRFAGTLPWNSQGYVCLVVILASVCVLKLNESHRLLYQLLAGFGLVFLLLTRSRGALLALSIALAIYLWVILSLKQKVLTFLLGGMLVLLFIMSGIGPRLIDVLNRGGEGSEDLTGRAPLWEELMTYVQQRPWTGYGYEAFWTPQRIDDVSGDQRWAIDTAHSGYIEGLLMLGAVGASLHTLTLLIGFFEGVRLFRVTGEFAFFLGASLCCVYLVGGFLEALWIVKTSQSSFYFALLICFMAIRPEMGSGHRKPKLSKRSEPLMGEMVHIG